MAGRAEAACAALARRQLVHLDELDLGDREDDELRDAHPRLDHERLARVGVQERHLELAAVAGVDQAGRVDERDAVTRREAGARLDEAGIALGDRDGEAGRDERPLAGRQLDVLARGEVESRVAVVGALGDDGVGMETPDRELDQALSRCVLSDGSAIRNGA